jgi:hypothetical protein
MSVVLAAKLGCGSEHDADGGAKLSSEHAADSAPTRTDPKPKRGHDHCAAQENDQHALISDWVFSSDLYCLTSGIMIL